MHVNICAHLYMVSLHILVSVYMCTSPFTHASTVYTTAWIGLDFLTNRVLTVAKSYQTVVEPKKFRLALQESAAWHMGFLAIHLPF